VNRLGLGFNADLRRSRRPRQFCQQSTSSSSRPASGPPGRNRLRGARPLAGPRGARGPLVHRGARPETGSPAAKLSTIVGHFAPSNPSRLRFAHQTLRAPWVARGLARRPEVPAGQAHQHPRASTSVRRAECRYLVAKSCPVLMVFFGRAQQPSSDRGKREWQGASSSDEG